VFLRLVAEMNDRFLEQQISIKFCMKLSLQMKHGAFNMILKGDNEVYNGKSRNTHDSSKFVCRYHK